MELGHKFGEERRMGNMFVVMGTTRALPGEMLRCGQVREERRLNGEKFQLRLQ
jgi:hypothetical protein